MVKGFESKSALRALARNALMELSEKEKMEKSKKIAQRLLSLPEYQAASSVFIYLSTAFEADTSAIINDALQKEKVVYVPVTYEKMYAVRIDKQSKFTMGKFGIRVPEYFQLEESPAIELAIIPLLAFDNNKNRLGHGKGYYDYFLSDFQGKKIALAFQAQCFSSIPMQSYDIVMDKIITEDRILI